MDNLFQNKWTYILLGIGFLIGWAITYSMAKAAMEKHNEELAESIQAFLISNPDATGKQIYEQIYPPVLPKV